MLRRIALLLLLVAAILPAAAAATEENCKGAQVETREREQAALPSEAQSREGAVLQNSGGNNLLQHRTSLAKRVMLDLLEEEEDDVPGGH
mmetsp:Transcript_101941/g.318584  ORF Transcript_101941/g.318584 Transcript_101941/m.318584 type:complete len:90 (+) Transcript_101941:69-338(+)